MKINQKFILPIVVLLMLLVSCKKERTCTCETKDIQTSLRTPRTRNGYTPPATTDVYIQSGKSSSSWGKVKKSEVKTFGECVDKTSTTVDTYTTVQSISTPTSVPPSTVVINFPVTYTVDVKNTNETTMSSCEIK